MTAGGIDWALAERVAGRVAARIAVPPGPVPADTDIAPLVADAARRVAAETGLTPPGDPEVRVVDRAGWIHANIGSFRRLLGPVFERASAHAGRGAGLLARMGAVELGALTGWLSGRVLGQYDVLVAGDPNDTDPNDTGAGGDGGGGAGEPDVVYLVGPNVAALEHRFGFDRTQFRTWVVLHELTHRAQFRGVPWMRDHYLGLIGEIVDGVETDPTRLLAALRGAIGDRDGARRLVREGGAAALFMPPAQRDALERVSGLMSLLEGHGDVVMDRAGADVLTEAPRFARVLRDRRRQQNPAAKVLQRLLGIEAKLAQYQAGEAFVAAVEAAAGAGALDVCWLDPANLPTAAEIRAPGTWLDRLGLDHAVA